MWVVVKYFYKWSQVLSYVLGKRTGGDGRKNDITEICWLLAGAFPKNFIKRRDGFTLKTDRLTAEGKNHKARESEN